MTTYIIALLLVYKHMIVWQHLFSYNKKTQLSLITSVMLQQESWGISTNSEVYVIRYQ